MAINIQNEASAPLARNRSPGFDGEQFINHLLDRIEQNARSASNAYDRVREFRHEVVKLEERLESTARGAANIKLDLDAADAKIEEWRAYALVLFNRLNAIDPHGRLVAKLPKRRRGELPKPPTPRVDAIPF